MIITIDGPIATGKSTVAKRLAQQIGFIYFDTGAIYRCLAYNVLTHKIDIQNPKKIEELLNFFNLDIRIKLGNHHYFVDNEEVTLAIRSPEVTAIVSEVAALPAVRKKLLEIQRENAQGVNAVFEGRDMGTTVFPDAEIKIFLTGNPEVRAKRRFKEFQAKFPEKTKELTLEKTLEEINKRDLYDSTRKTSPLRQAKDAFIIDTSNLSIDDIVLKILEYKDSLKVKYNPPTVP